MSKIKATQRLIVEDFPDQKDWIPKLFYIVNRFITDVITAVNGGLTFGENITGTEKLLDFTFISLSTSFPQGFKWTLSTRPEALSVVSATKDGSPAMVAVQWEYTPDGLVQVTDAVQLTSAPAVSALTVNSRYKIRVRVSP